MMSAYHELAPQIGVAGAWAEATGADAAGGVTCCAKIRGSSTAIMTMIRRRTARSGRHATPARIICTGA